MRGDRTGAIGMAEILLVEDDADIREDLAALLRDEGFSVKTATNGRDALQQLAGAPPPCVILLDLMMPVMSGWDFRAKQLADPALAAVPVVLLSAATDLPRHASQLKANGYLAKPIELEQLFEVVQRHCC